jgi:hypothetical protein
LAEDLREKLLDQDDKRELFLLGENGLLEG